MVHITCTISATPARTLHFNVVTTDDPLMLIIIPGIDNKEVKEPRRFKHCVNPGIWDPARTRTQSVCICSVLV